MEKSDVQYSIKKSERIIKGVMDWSKTELVERSNHLLEIQERLENEITEEERLMTKISSKLALIEKLQLEISKRVVETNGFTYSIQE